MTERYVEPQPVEPPAEEDQNDQVANEALSEEPGAEPAPKETEDELAKRIRSSLSGTSTAGFAVVIKHTQRRRGRRGSH